MPPYSTQQCHYRRYFDGTWGFGNWRQRLRPTPGNHEYITPSARGYFDYFFGGSRRGNEYCSFDLGTCHIISLDSEIPHGPGSPQITWLTTDLGTTRQPCILAFWHRPLWSSGVTEGGSPDVSSFWDALYPAGADVILNAHEHNYERFAPLDSHGELDPDDGIVQFVVGTGGRGLLPLGARAPGSVAANATTFGFLEVTLKPAGYVWRFVPASGGTYSDSGEASCHQ